MTSDKQPLTHETLWMMPRVGSPLVSPDGTLVVFAILEPSYEAAQSVSDLWLVPTDGTSQPRRLTNTRAAENGVAWSADSRKIAFTTKREGDEAEQVYILDLAGGGEAQRLTELSTGASNPQWSPDGACILFESFVHPNADDDEANKARAAEIKARKYSVRTYEQFPVRFWNDWLDERRPTLLVQSVAHGAKPKDLLAGSELSRSPGFSGIREDSGGLSLSPVWSPDGREVVFVATVESASAARGYVDYKLYSVSVTDRSGPRCIVDVGGDYGQLRFSPRQDTLLYVFSRHEDEVYSLPRLCRIPWPVRGPSVELAPAFDLEITSYVLSTDGRRVWLLASDGPKQSVYSVAVEGGDPVLIVEPETGGYSSLSASTQGSSNVLVANYGSSVNPSEIVLIDPESGVHRYLTQVNTDRASCVDWLPPERFYFRNDHGHQIHNMLVLPPKFDSTSKYPLLVIIHGGPANNNADQISLRWNYHLLAAPGYVVLLTDYTGSSGFGEKFARSIKLDPLKTPANDVDKAVEEAVSRYSFIDGSRVAAAGASYGGHLVNWLQAASRRYKCFISHAGQVNLGSQWGTSDEIFVREVASGGVPWGGSTVWRDQSAITHADSWATPTLVSIGERDFRVPINNALEHWSALQRLGIPSRLLVWPEAWHWITRPEDSRHFYAEVARWLDLYL